MTAASICDQGRNACTVVCTKVNAKREKAHDKTFQDLWEKGLRGRKQKYFKISYAKD